MKGEKMKGGGGSDNGKARLWWWSNNSCTRSSIMMLGPSSWGTGHPLLKVAMGMTMMVLLFSIYQSCVSHDTTKPVWLSLSFVSRPSFLVSSAELSQQPQERPVSAVFLPSSPLPPPFDERSSDSSNSALKPATLPPEDSSNSSAKGTAIPTTQTRDGNSEESDGFEAQDGSVNSAQEASNLTSESVFGALEKNLLPDTTQSSQQGLKTSDSGDSFSWETDLLPDSVESSEQASSVSDSVSSSVVTDLFEGKESTVESGTTTSPVGPDEDSTNGQKTMEERKDEAEQVEPVVWSNSTGDLESPEIVASIQAANEVVVPPRNTSTGDDGVLIATALPGALPSTELELLQGATIPTVSTELEIPAHVEKPIDKRHGKPERELFAAKQAIEAATMADADPSLYPVIFRNISAFSKSYKLMEEMFRIYVYAEGGKQLVHTGPLLGIYASEGKFIDSINRGSPFIEEDPEKAHMFFLPYSVTQMTLTIYVEGSHSMQPLNTFVKNYVDEVAAKYPFWNRSRGADHFFVSCHDWGPATARDHEELRTNAVKVVCNADLTEEYVLGKDASLPEIYLHNHKPVKVGGPGAIRRTYLAFFAGQMHGHVRPLLIERWKDKDPDMKIYEVLPKDIERKMNYVQHMKNSKYCICAAGFEVNSPRIVESIYYDCVPVIIADNFVLPFSDVLNWSTFSVTIPESEIPNLKSILLSISDKQYRSMQKRLSKVRQHFIWNDQPVKYDVFHMILHSVWMSRLNHLNP